MFKKSKNHSTLAFLLLGLALTLTAGSAIGNASCANAAKKNVVSIKLNKKNIAVYIGKSYHLKATVRPVKAKIKWTSSKKSVAVVNAKGKVTAKKAGTAKITANATYKKFKKKAICKVTVREKSSVASPAPSTAPASAAPAPSTAPASASPAPSMTPASPVPTPTQAATIIKSISFEEEKVTMNLGETCKLEPKFDPADVKLSDCTITNSKDYVASVDENGTITANYIGITRITVTSKTDSSISAVLRIDVTADFSAPEGFDTLDASIAHGELTDLNYTSDYREGGKGHARMWLPPNYDVSKKYNLLFCLHGGSDTEYYWTVDGGGGNDGCNGGNVLDYLYSKMLMEDTIVVFPHGIIPYDASKTYPNTVPNEYLSDFWKDHYLLEFELIYNLMPYMRENFPVYDTPEHTAICGLSMGCAQSMEIGLKHPELFDYVGCYSAGPFGDDESTVGEVEQPFVNSEEDAAKINENLKLLFFITGENDHLHSDSLRQFITQCDDYGLDHSFYVVPKVGHDDYCWNRCLYAFMQYAFK